MKDTYTLRDLIKNHTDYEDNFKLLMLAVEKNDEPSHLKYAREEKRLDALQCQIRKSLHVFTHDSCPIRHNKRCVECTGYYHEESKKRKTMIEDVKKLEDGDWYYDCFMHERNYPDMRSSKRKMFHIETAGEEVSALPRSKELTPRGSRN